MQTRTAIQDLLTTNSQFNTDELEFNHEALALFLKHEFKQKKNKDQVFVIAGSEDLRALLPRLRLTQEGDEAFILLRPYIHSMVLYLRYIKGEVHCFIFDSQNWGVRYYPTRLIIDALNQHLQPVNIYLSNKELQSQEKQRGCTEYSLFCFYLIDENGSDLFEVITESNNTPLGGKYPNTYLLEEQAFPWQLLVGDVEEKKSYFMEELASILNTHYVLEGKLDRLKIEGVVREMQGCLLPRIRIDNSRMYEIRVDVDDKYIEIQFKNKDCVYTNFLMHSNHIDPGSVIVDSCDFLLNEVAGIKINYDKEKYRLTYQAEDLPTLKSALQTLRLQSQSLYQKNMRQQLALQVWVEEMEAIVELKQKQEALPLLNENWGLRLFSNKEMKADDSLVRIKKMGLN